MHQIIVLLGSSMTGSIRREYSLNNGSISAGLTPRGVSVDPSPFASPVASIPVSVRRACWPIWLGACPACLWCGVQKAEQKIQDDQHIICRWQQKVPVLALARSALVYPRLWLLAVEPCLDVRELFRCALLLVPWLLACRILRTTSASTHRMLAAWTMPQHHHRRAAPTVQQP
jgi:hypothetical protein